MKKWIRVLPILGVAVLAAGIGHQSALAKKSEDSVIADRIFIGDVAVGGMTDDEATAAVEKYVDDLADEKITLTINDVSVEATAADLGLSWQDTESVQNAVAIELVAEVSKPKGSEEELQKVKDVLGTFSTKYASSASGRKANIANGSKKIDGTVIYPGDEFSVYQTVAPFNADNGYKLAGAYENGTTVDAYGGGICQVSTTLYNAVIRAELEVTERSGHSMIVNYVDPSADAAIAGEYKDFKFKNSTEAPIYIESYANGTTISFTIYGQETRPANRSISFVSETLSTTDPGVKFQESSDAVGTISKTQSSHVGKSARLWKVVTVDGVEESREVFNKTTYKASPTIYAVGVSSENPEAVSAMKAAIATQDEGTIRAAAAQWKNAVQQPEQTTDPTQDPNASQTQPADGTNQAGQTDNSAQQTQPADNQSADQGTTAQ